MAEVKDKIVTVESLSAVHEHNKEAYMPKINPTGSGTLSIDSIRIGNVLIESTQDMLSFTFLTEEAVAEEG